MHYSTLRLCYANHRRDWRRAQRRLSTLSRCSGAQCHQDSFMCDVASTNDSDHNKLVSSDQEDNLVREKSSKNEMNPSKK